VEVLNNNTTTHDTGGVCAITMLGWRWNSSKAYDTCGVFDNNLS